MIKKLVLLIVTVVLLPFTISARSYQGVLLNSAETIQPWNFKLTIAPVMILGKNGGDSVWGIAGKGGLGLTDRVDVELSGAYFENFLYLGVDLEYWLLKESKVNVSASVGWHMTDFKNGADSTGIDTTLIASTRPVNNLEITGGLKASFDSFKGTNISITLIHFVPGMEFKITNQLDFLAEFGIALNNDSSNYLVFGFSYYFQK